MCYRQHLKKLLNTFISEFKKRHMFASYTIVTAAYMDGFAKRKSKLKAPLISVRLVGEGITSQNVC